MILAEGRAFVLESWTGPLRGQARAGADRPVWLIPLEGEASTGEEKLAPGSVWIVEGEALLDLERSARLLAAYPGASPDRRLLEPMNGAVSAHSPQEG